LTLNERSKERFSCTQTIAGKAAIAGVVAVSRDGAAGTAAAAAVGRADNRVVRAAATRVVRAAVRADGVAAARAWIARRVVLGGRPVRVGHSRRRLTHRGVAPMLITNPTRVESVACTPAGDRRVARTEHFLKHRAPAPKGPTARTRNPIPEGLPAIA